MSKRFYADYREWEDYKNGMWGNEINQDNVNYSIELLSGPQIADVMLKVVDFWPISSKHNLSNLSSNRRSWLGQAACSLNHKATELETRTAWKKLTKQQQSDANHYADLAIEHWELITNFTKEKYVKEDFTL